MIMNYSPIVTLDVDWAPDFMIDYASELLTKQGIHATWFITHDSPSIQKLSNNKLFEIGLHPNFDQNSTQGDDFHSILSNLKSIAPNAKSIRMHNLLQSTPILKMLPQFEIENECSLMLEKNYTLQPFFSKFFNLFRFPFIWADDVAMADNFNWTKSFFEISSSLQILNFHPVHIFLNSNNTLKYELAKSEVGINNLNENNVEKYVNTTEPGTQTFFKILLEQLSNEKTYTILELQHILKSEKHG